MKAPRAKRVFSPALCRAARGLLKWSVETLARRSGLELEAVELYEEGDSELSAEDLGAIGATLYAAGVIAVRESLAGEGVRFRSPSAGLSDRYVL